MISVEEHRKIKEDIIRQDLQDKVSKLLPTAELVDYYLNTKSDQSLQGLNNYLSSYVLSNYWIMAIYPSEIIEAQNLGFIDIKKLDTLSIEDCSWDLGNLLLRGFGGVSGKIESKPPSRLNTALGQIINFLYTLAGEASGKQHVSHFNTFLAPFVVGESEKSLRFKLKGFLFNINVPTRVGFNPPETSITLDSSIPTILKNKNVIINGKISSNTYGEYSKEADEISRTLMEFYNGGDDYGNKFPFPKIHRNSEYVGNVNSLGRVSLNTKCPEREFYRRLYLAVESLRIKRKIIQKLLVNGFYPYLRVFLDYQGELNLDTYYSIIEIDDYELHAKAIQYINKEHDFLNFKVNWTGTWTK